jgi:DivIVA domain-containing protein
VSDNERRQRTISSTPRLTPDEVASRSFPTAFRGISETDVRAFLKRVSEDLAMVRGREQELMATIDELEARLRNPRPLDEQELLDALGEETTRLLRSAREAATDIRGKAEERAARLVHDAHEEAKRVRQEADEVLGLRTHEAETVAQGLLQEAEQRASDLMRVADDRASEVRTSAERFAEDLRARVEHEAALEIETSRERGLALIEEATSLRERIIDDLARRRELLTGQLEELRAGRDRLLDSYRVVKRTFLDATEALAQVEARATAGRPVTGPDPTDLSGTLAEETEAAHAAGLEAQTEAEPEAAAAADSEAEPAADEAAGTAGEHAEASSSGSDAAPTAERPDAPDGEPGDDDSEAPANLAAVDDLFARLRAGAQGEEIDVDLTVEPDEASGPPESEPEAAATPAPAGAKPKTQKPKPKTAKPEPAPVAAKTAGTTTADEEEPAWLSQRDEALAPLRVTLVRRFKLTIGNEQNEVLDKVRRQKGRPDAATVLPDLDAQIATWSTALSKAASDAYRAARTVDGGEAGELPDDLLPGLARAIVDPLRERLIAAIDGSHEPGETSHQVAERIGARYREWKNRSAESSSDDTLVAAYARGRYDAAADGAMLAWSTPPSGCCPDCADNALEPTRKGEPFPTGQTYPPAHAGCRCAITASVGAESTSST